MSLETVLKNIYSYVELLQTVCTDKVVTWDRSNLKDALKWAKYCEQVHKQAQGKAYLVQLKESVRKMGELPWAIGERTVTLDTLREAEMILKQALLQNPNVSDSVYEELICSYGDPCQIPQALIQDITELSSVTQASQVAQQCLQTFSKSQILTAEHVDKYSSAQMLLEYATKLMNCPRERQTPCENLLVSKLHRIGCDIEGMQVVAMACSLPSVTQGSSQAQVVMVNWLIRQPKQSAIFHLCGRLLAQVSRVHFVFYKVYIQHLIRTVQTVETAITADGLVTYRLPGESSYEDIVTRFSQLIRVGDPVTSATLHTVETLTRKDSVGMWRKLSRNLLTLKKKCQKG